MSLNRFRSKIKKLKGQSEKNSASESSLIKPSVVTPSPNSPSLLGLTVSKDNKRKAMSVSSPPDVSSSPVHMVRTK